MKSAYIIGNYFAASRTSRILSVDDCRCAISTGSIPFGTGTVSFGQGVSLPTAIEIKTRLAETGAIAASKIIIPSYFYRKISKEVVHKRFLENVILSSLDEESDSIFRTHLFIDSVPEVIQDHLTGKHLPGMLLLEAARQGTNAVLEARKSRGELLGDLSIAQLSWQTAFSQYAYPLPLSILFTIEHSKQCRGSVHERVRAEFFQLGLGIGRIISEYALMPKERASEIDQAMLAFVENLPKEPL